LQRAEKVASEMRDDAARGTSGAVARAGFVPLPSCRSLPPGQVAYSKDGIVDAGGNSNELTSDESGRGWRLLFDGKTTRGWRGFGKRDIPQPWRIENGALTLAKLKAGESVEDRGDVVTEAEFGNFELRLQWAAEPGANSGIFFFAREGSADRIWKAAPEMQVLDDARHEDGAEPSHRAGALYDIYAPKCDALKPAGEYNDARLVVRNGKVEHWLNGYRVVEYELDSADFRTRVARSKFRAEEEFAKVRRGRLGLQDHGDVIRFRSIRVREL
jgi:cytochrome c